MKKKKKFDFDDPEFDEAQIDENAEVIEEGGSLTKDELNMIKDSVASAPTDRRKMPHYDTSDKATLFRFISANKIFTVAALVIVFSIILSVLGGSAYFAVQLFNEMKDYTVIIGEDEPYKVDTNEAVINGVLYIDLRKIAAHAGLTLSGSRDRMQFTSIKNGTYLLFENNNEFAFINGGRTEIQATTVEGDKIVSAKAYVNESQCLVPLNFLSRTIDESTMSFIVDAKSKTIYVRPKYLVYDGDLENREMKDILFITDNFDVTIPESEKPTYTYTYTIDITPYLSSIDTEYLMLVNKSHSAGKYTPSNLKLLDCPTVRSGLKLDYDAAVALEAMMTEMAAAGITDTYVTSAYRSYEYQYDLYWGYVEKEKMQDPDITQEEAERRASEYSARPGESEHQTGLCFDFITSSMGGVLDEKFEKSDAFKWLSKNAYKYGFILRYPADDVSSTGYQYEPWHYRFVGRQAASEMYFSGMCFEEYLEGQ